MNLLLNVQCLVVKRSFYKFLTKFFYELPIILLEYKFILDTGEIRKLPLNMS